MALILKNLTIFLPTILLCIASASGAIAGNKTLLYVDKELILTQNEKLAFDKFKAAVYLNITDQWKDYLRQDLFLLRWIRAKNLNVDVATKDMFEFMDFLQKNRIDKIRDEDFSDVAADFPAHFTHDRQGRPVFYYSASEWNVRRGIIQGKRTRLLRYSYMLTFKLLDHLIDINKKDPNVTQGIVLMNMAGFNVFQHSCAACIGTYLTLLELYERYIPGNVKEVIVINATQSYLAALELVKTILSPYTRKTLHVFGTNRNKWGPYLDARIDRNKLPWEFGGNSNKMDLVI